MSGSLAAGQPPEDMREVMEAAREVRLGQQTTAEAFYKRLEMVERGEAPPIGEEES